MPIEDRPQEFLARLNTAQRVILFISGLAAIGLVVFPQWTCGDPGSGGGYRQTEVLGRAFLFNWESVPAPRYGGCGGAGVVVSARLLAELMVPLAIGALGYFVFKTPVAAAPSAATPAPPPQEPQAAAPTAPTTGGDLV